MDNLYSIFNTSLCRIITEYSLEDDLFEVIKTKNIEIIKWYHYIKSFEYEFVCSITSDLMPQIYIPSGTMNMSLFSEFYINFVYSCIKPDKQIICDDEIIEFAFTNGYLDISKWLVEIFNISKENYSHIINRLFHNVCKNGHLKMAKWLVEKYKITKKDYTDTNIDTFEEVCKNGNLEMIKWLILTFKIKKV
jgi:hypothetical protein